MSKNYILVRTLSDLNSPLYISVEQVFSEHIEQCRTLLLDIDVIKCSCDKKFDR